jgi:Phage portal protein, SPP1 Gp6-like
MSIVTLLAAEGTAPLILSEQPEGTVGYWLDRLSLALDVQAAEAAVFTAYDEGAHPLQFATSKFRETFGSLFSEFADNWAPVVVDSSNERLTVQGFRFGSSRSANPYAGDKAAWDIWQENNLDADSGLAHREAIRSGTAYLIVDVGDPPRITVESPVEVVVAHAPGDRRKRIAALKRWIDYDRIWHATVYLAEGTFRFRTREAVEPGADIRWEVDDPERVSNPFGNVIPVIPMRNNPAMISGGRSDLAVVIDIQNAINKIVTDMMVASEYAAFRQRWATGIEIPVDPETGVANASRFLSSVSRMWTVDDPDAKFGDFNTTDLGNYVKAVETLIQHLAAQTRTPPHYLTAGLGQWPSGDSLKASETGLVAKVRRKQVDFGEAWEEAMRLAFYAIGDETRAGAIDAEVIWADPEFRTEGERVDALTKMATLGVPHEALWQRWGATPQEINRWRAMADAEAIRAGIASGAQPIPPAPPQDGRQPPAPPQDVANQPPEVPR